MLIYIKKKERERDSNTIHDIICLIQTLSLFTKYYIIVLYV